MKKMVSIIVPVYNMAQYLRICVESLICQSYETIEIILVNDGSEDSSGRLCDEWAEKDNRIRVVHKPNGGLSSARNAGLDVAKGTYISFVDSDDYLHPDTIKHMVETMASNNCDVVCVKSNIINEQGMITHCSSTETMSVQLYSASTYIKGICEKWLSESVCDKLFTRDIMVNRRFEEGRLNEDFFFLSKLLMEGENVCVLDFAGYNYLKHEGTITSNRTNFASLKDAIINSCQLMQMAHELGSETEAYFAYSALYQLRVFMIVLPRESVKRGSADYLFAKDKYHDCLPYINRTNLKNADKLFLRAMMAAPRVTKLLVDILRTAGGR